MYEGFHGTEHARHSTQETFHSEHSCKEPKLYMMILKLGFVQGLVVSVVFRDLAAFKGT